eukprot:GHVR01118839.1.p1 GENE.GHVR01118839.1~~GHVR01118839.1.p1  ORF type:complete len:249 (-),score=27.97 GHVR01118839.1:42-788(-)
MEDVTKPILRPRNEGEGLKKIEHTLRKRNFDLSKKNENTQKIIERRKAMSKVRKDTFIPAAAFVERSKKRHRDRVRSRATKSNAMPSGLLKSNVVFAIRNNRVGMCRTTRTLLKQNNLNKKDDGVVLSNDDVTHTLIRLCRPYIFFGYPSLDSVRSLLTRKAELCVNGERVLLSDNVLVEEHLGHFGMYCVEDVVHHLWTKGQYSRRILECFAPFTLSSIKKAEGLDAQKIEEGNRKEDIDAKIASIL